MRARVAGLSALFVTIFASGSLPASAQDYPNRTVTIVAPSAPGGLYSLFSRLIGSKFEQRLGKSFVVENRPGAGSIVGMQSVARAAGDGYTLMVVNSTGMAANVTLHKSLPYDPVADFVPIGLLAMVPEVLVVNAALPIQTPISRASPNRREISHSAPRAPAPRNISAAKCSNARSGSI